MKHINLFENISLATKPHIIKASPKSDMAIIWFDIWDTQNGSKAKLLINHSFNLGWPHRHSQDYQHEPWHPPVPQLLEMGPFNLFMQGSWFSIPKV